MAYARQHDLRVIATNANENRRYYLYANTFKWLHSDLRHYMLISRQGEFALFMVRPWNATERLPTRSGAILGHDLDVDKESN